MTPDLTPADAPPTGLPTPPVRPGLPMDALPVPTALSQNGVYVEVNQAYLRLFGFDTAAELLGRPLLDQIAPPQRDRIRGLNRAREGTAAAPAEYETLGLRKDGATFPMQVQVTPVPWGEGKGTLACFTDLSQRTAVETRLQASEAWFRAYVEQSIDVLFTLNAQGCFTFVSPAWERHFGFPVAEVLGKPFAPYVHPEDVQPCLQSLLRVLSTGQPETSPTYRVQHADGSWHRFVANGSLLAAPGGERLFLGVAHDITEAHRAQEALREAHEYLEQITRSALVGTVVYGPDLRFRLWNPFMERLTGMPAPQVLGRHPREVFPFLQDAGILDRLERALGGEELATLDVPFRDARTGRTRWLTDTTAPLRNTQGEIIGVVSSVLNITERKQAEAALVQERENAERYLAVAQVILVAFDAEARITLLNPKGYEVLGYGEGELAGQDWFQVCLPPEEREAVRGVYRSILAGDLAPVEYFENHIQRKNGERRLIAWNNAMLRDGQGRIIGTLSSGEDITERRRSEDALKASEEQARVIFETSDAGIILVAPTGRITFANQRMAELFGLSLGDLIGTAYPDHLHPSEQSTGDARMRSLISGEIQSVSVERKYLRVDGTTFWGHLSGRRVEHPDGSLRTLVGIITDVTKRREAEHQQAMLQSQLHQVQKMESLGSLAGGLAHDMNNVLGAILGLASAHIEAQAPGSPTQRAFGTIIKAAERGGNMLKSLLSFARRSAAEAQDLDLNAILREEVRLLECTTLSQVRLCLDLDPALRLIRGDAGALNHAFMNLCVNAVDAMPGNGTLTLRTRNLSGDWVEAQVQDTGAGMSKDVLAKAMDPFFTTKDVGKGTGLGLSLVYSTVKACGGELALHSEPGQGTCVTLRFPALKEAAPALEASGAYQTVPRLGSLKVLLVDDDELIQSSMEGMLHLLGHRATQARSGEEALALLEAGERPDVVILDMNMPGLGGAGTLPRLRALHPRLPVLLATGRADQAAQDLVRAHAEVTLLSKPFGMKELQAHLVPHLQG